MKKNILLLFIFLSCFVSNALQAKERVIEYTKASIAEPMAPTYLVRDAKHLAIRNGERRMERLGPSKPSLSDPTFASQSHPLLATCRSEMLALTTPAALVNYLETHNYDNCIDDLWDYGTDLKTLFTQNNLTAVLNEIARLTPLYNGTNNSHMLELLFFARVAYYHNWYNPSDYINLGALRPLIATTLNQLFANVRMYDITATAGSILEQAVQLLDAAEVNVATAASIENILSVFYASFNNRITIYQQGSALYAVFSTISRSVYNGLVTQVTPNLINLLKKYALLVLARNNYWVPSNGAWDLGIIAANIPAAKTAAFAALEAAYNTQVQWSSPWVWVVSSLTLNSDCVTLSAGQTVCLSSTQNELKARLFPSTYTFDNNALIAKTSLSLNTVTPLFYATNEVKSQVGRVIKGLVPVANDPNATLNIYLYATLNDYQDYQTFIFNLSSDNGGIYIEQDGTFYTYQRTTSESIYSLQELFRHEYTHYVLGRYLVPGMWGEVPIYDNNRMVFFDEGLAEFFAGSLPRDGVAERASLVRQIKNDGVANRLSIAQIVTADYNNFYFYRYSGLFFHFLYTKHIDILQKMTDSVRANNINAFDTLKNQLMNNSALNTEYQSYLDAAVANLKNLTTPTTAMPTDANLIYGDASQIQSLLIASNMVTQTTCTQTANTPQKLFACKGRITAQALPTKDAIQGWYNLNQQTNAFQKKVVAPKAGTNLDWLTCWFNPIEWSNGANGTFVPNASYQCNGPLGTGVSPPVDPAKELQADFRKTRLGIYATCSVSGNKVVCDVPSSTQLVSTTTPDSKLMEMAENNVDIMQADVIKLSPSKYANLTCDLKPNTFYVVPYPSNGSKYAVFTGLCTNPI